MCHASGRSVRMSEMDQQPADRRHPCLVKRSERSLWDTAVRLVPGVDPADVLARLASQLVVVAADLGDSVRLHLEPHGDSCDTGHWVDIECYAGTVWADMTPWPDRFGGAVPAQIDAELELAGWVLIAPDDPPEASEAERLRRSMLPEEDRQVELLSARRLVADVDDVDFTEWAALVADGTRRVIDPSGEGWYFVATTEVPEKDVPAVEGRVDVVPSDLFAGEWSIDLGMLLQPGEWQRAVWRSDTEAGAICCDLGLHQYHEPPCSGGRDDGGHPSGMGTDDPE